MRYICKDCGNMFDISKGEEEFFRSKGLELPKRCKDCRDKKKNGTEASQEKQNTAKSSSGAKSFDSSEAYKRNSNTSGKGRKPIGTGAKNLILTAVALIVALIVVFALPKLKGTDENTPSVTTADVETSLQAEDNQGVAEGDGDATTAEAYSQPADETAAPTTEKTTEAATQYHFANRMLLVQHYEKHGIDMGFTSAEDYEAAASAVITNPDSLHRTEQEDGDDVYYLMETGEFVVLSVYGKIRTYYIASYDYFLRQ